MDRYEATKVVFSRIQNLDPDNASKIMGLLLIQDHGEKEMIRLALGPDSLLHSFVIKARQELGISPNTPSTPSTPSPPSPFFSNSTSTTGTNNHHHPFSLSRQNSNPSPNPSRLFLPNGLKIPSSLSLSSLPSPSSASSPSPSWGNSVFPDFHNPDELISPSNSSAPTFLPSSELMDEMQLQDQLSFLNDPDCPTGNGDSLLFPHNGSSPGWGAHRRSYSVSDISMGTDDPTGGLGWKPCLYYQRGFCKNGTSCRFVHHHHHHHHHGGGLVSDPDSVLVGSPTSKLEMMEHCHELLRSKSMQQNKLLAAVQLMHGGGGGGSGSFPYSGGKCSPLSLLAQQQQQTESQRMAAALMMGDDMHKFGRSSRLNRGHYLMNCGNGGDSSPGSRQIYLTFPADSTFREEDVSNYFSIFGPVQDVRIPYQQKRMFGFVTFVYPQTVRMILAKGNPHFVCDARVLVKPYKEKGKVPDKFRKQQFQQQLERGDFSACSSPTGLDSRDPFDRHLGERMMSPNTDDFWRRKLEDQAELQQALDLQSRRLMGLTLDLKRSQHHRALSSGAAPFPSPCSYSPSFNQPHQFSSSSDRSSPDGCQENESAVVTEEDLHSQFVNGNGNGNDYGKGGGSSKNDNSNDNGKASPAVSHDEGNNNLPESLLDHNLPDSPFASPTKGSACDRSTAAFASFVGNDAASVVSSASTSSSLFAATSTIDTSPFKSCNFQLPRFATGHGAIEM